MNEKMRGRRITCLAFDARGAELSLLTKLLTTRQTSRCSVQCVRLWTANIICWAASGCTHAHTDACTGLHWSELDTQPAQTHTHTMCAAAKPPNPKSRDRPDQVGIVASGIMQGACLGRLLLVRTIDIACCSAAQGASARGWIFLTASCGERRRR